MKRLFFLLATLTASGSVAGAQTVDSIVTIPMTCDRYLYIYPTLRDSLSRTQRKAYFCTPDKQYTLTVIRNGERLDIPVTNLNDKTLWH